MTIERKYERDVDILLAEEFIVNATFAEKFKAQTKFAGRAAKVVDVWVSRSNNQGESDVIVVYQSAEGEKFALLIEDKIDAPLQPDQADRYRLRAERDITLGNYSAYEILLCAPQYYIDHRTDLANFSHLISFERVAEMIHVNGDERAEYRAKFIETAGSKHINRWLREDDPATNAFWDSAYKLATTEFPTLEMKQLKVTKGTNWITFRPHDFPTQPKRVYIELKGQLGRVDLTFSSTIAHLFQPKVSMLLEPDMTIHQAGASTVVRIGTPAFSITDGAEAGLPKVRSAFVAVSRLIAFFRSARADIELAAKEATPL